MFISVSYIASDFIFSINLIRQTTGCVPVACFAGWATKSFVNLWTEDLASRNKMFIKITEGDDVNYYTINFN